MIYIYISVDDSHFYLFFSYIWIGCNDRACTWCNWSTRHISSRGCNRNVSSTFTDVSWKNKAPRPRLFHNGTIEYSIRISTDDTNSGKRTEEYIRIRDNTAFTDFPPATFSYLNGLHWAWYCERSKVYSAHYWTKSRETQEWYVDRGNLIYVSYISDTLRSKWPKYDANHKWYLSNWKLRWLHFAFEMTLSPIRNKSMFGLSLCIFLSGCCHKSCSSDTIYTQIVNRNRIASWVTFHRIGVEIAHGTRKGMKPRKQWRTIRFEYLSTQYDYPFLYQFVFHILKIRIRTNKLDSYTANKFNTNTNVLTG